MTDDNADSKPFAAHLLTVAAGIAGAMGVALAAIAAHKVDSPALVSASTLLMVHAAAAVGIAGLACRGRGFIAAGSLMLAAVALFAGDVTLHTLTGSHIFPYAAPTGGSLTIASWIVLAIVALRNAWADR